MVASRHPSSRSAGVRSVDRQIASRPVPRRERPGPVVAGCTGARPPLRLVVDNTIGGSAGATAAPAVVSVRGGAADGQAGGPASISFELGAWLRASVALAEARWLLARQRRINRYGNFGLAGRIGGLVPMVGLVAVVMFGALLGLRLAQESSSAATLQGGTGSIAALATSTSGANEGSHAGSSTGSSVGSDSAVVVVHPGDTLWSIALSRYPERDPRDVVDAFVEANGLSTIRSGQQLVVPAALLED